MKKLKRFASSDNFILFVVVVVVGDVVVVIIIPLLMTVVDSRSKLVKCNGQLEKDLLVGIYNCVILFYFLSLLLSVVLCGRRSSF